MDEKKQKSNPLNNIPIFDDKELESFELSSQRETSSIPSTTESKMWEYPSPKQFYAALMRKGKDTREEDVDTMGSWQEILKWENKYHCGCKDISLLKFEGKPTKLSPKARFNSIFFNTPKPFDRHDWIVSRCGERVRYVIDYYSVPGESEASFKVDVRPALDSFTSLYDLLKHYILN